MPPSPASCLRKSWRQVWKYTGTGMRTRCRPAASNLEYRYRYARGHLDDDSFTVVPAPAQRSPGTRRPPALGNCGQRTGTRGLACGTTRIGCRWHRPSMPATREVIPVEALHALQPEPLSHTRHTACRLPGTT